MGAATRTRTVTVDEARKILGEGRVYGPAETDETIRRFDPDVPDPIPLFGDKFPDISFPESEYEQAAEHDQILVLFPAGLTIERINGLRKGKRFSGRPLIRSKDVTTWSNHEFYKKYGFYTAEWRFVGSGLVPGSIGQSPVGQMRALADYVSRVFSLGRQPDTVRLALTNFDSQEEELSKEASGNPGGVAAILTQLILSRYFQAGPAELFWLSCVEETLGVQSPLREHRANTRRRTTTDRQIARVGDFGNRDGATVDTVPAHHVCPTTGVYFSRGVLAV